MPERIDRSPKSKRKHDTGRQIGNAIKYSIVGSIEGGVIGGMIDGVWWLSDTLAHGNSELFPNDKIALVIVIALLGATVGVAVGSRQRK